eukprot:175353-Rhodomonas_salina.1
MLAALQSNSQFSSSQASPRRTTPPPHCQAQASPLRFFIPSMGALCRSIGPEAAKIEINLQSLGRSRGCCHPAFPPGEAL